MEGQLLLGERENNREVCFDGRMWEIFFFFPLFSSFLLLLFALLLDIFFSVVAKGELLLKAWVMTVGLQVARVIVMSTNVIA